MLRKVRWILYKCYHFSFLLELSLLAQCIFSRFLPEKSWPIQLIYATRDRATERYLLHHGYVAKDIPAVEEEPGESVVWVYWAQGWDNPPANVLMNLRSMQTNLRNCRIVPIDNGNLGEYVTMPGDILRKMERKEITLTHFSDLLRYSLLAEHGGIWLDASIFVAHPVDFRAMLEHGFFTIRLKEDPTNRRIVSRARWVIGAIGFAKRNSKMALLMRESLYAYYRGEQEMISYFVTDYLMDLMLKTHPDMQKQLDAVPYKHQEWLNLSAIANCAVTGREKVLRKFETTSFFYLPWRGVYKQQADEKGGLTFYGYYCENIAGTGRAVH